MASENKLQEIIKTSLENIKSLTDSNTIIGTPINTASGTTIIPISKISIGFATGGADFNGKHETAAKQNFSAGGGTGVSITPVAFLTVSPDGDVDIVNVGLKNPSDPVEQISDLIDRSPDILAKIKAIFSKNEEAEDEEA